MSPRKFDDVLVQSVKVMEAMGAPGVWVCEATGMSRASLSSFANGDLRPGVPAVRPPIRPRRPRDERALAERVAVRARYAALMAAPEAHASHLAERRRQLDERPESEKAAERDARRLRYATDPVLREKTRAAARKRRAENPEVVARDREGLRAWAEAHPAYMREARMRANMRRRGFVNGFPGVRIEPLVVLERSDGACGICGMDVDPCEFVCDHVIPLSRGGAHHYANLQAAHSRCNLIKGDLLTEELAERRPDLIEEEV